MKERARELDKECWISYAGKGREYKSYMELRRTESLRQAKKEMPEEEVERCSCVGWNPNCKLHGFGKSS